MAFERTKLKTYREENYMAKLARFVEAGLGITIVPSLSLHQFPTLGVRMLETPRVSRPIYLIRRRGRTLSAAADAFFNEISETNFDESQMRRTMA